eukprot:171343_1
MSTGTVAVGQQKRRKRPRVKIKDAESHSKNSRSNHILYDPYYCDGSTARLLKDLGFTNVKHEKRDFYADVKNDTVPRHHTLVTNPPYSEDHKERCVQYAVNNLRRKKNTHKKGSTSTSISIGISKKSKDHDHGDNNGSDGDLSSVSQKECAPVPFFILMPNYIAVRNHFRSAILDGVVGESRLSQGQGQVPVQGEDPLDILYVVPSTPYEYAHPEGTGKEIPPFQSIWFCGIPVDKVDAAKEAFRKAYGANSVGMSAQQQQQLKQQQGAKKKSSASDFTSNSSSSSSTPRLFSTLEELKSAGAVPSENRKSSKQRRKERLKRLKGSTLGPPLSSSAPYAVPIAMQGHHRNIGDNGTANPVSHSPPLVPSQKTASQSGGPKKKNRKRNRKNTKDRYRDENGVRKKKRF